MRICGVKLTHDAAIAVIENGKLLLCVEMEKIGNGERYRKMRTMDEITTTLRDNGVDPASITNWVIDGWKDGTIRIDDTDVVVANYSEFDGNTLTTALTRATSAGHASYNHISGHVLGAYVTSPFSISSAPSYVVTWDGGTQARAHFVKPVEQLVLFEGKLGCLYGTIYTIMGLYFGPYKQAGVLAYTGNDWRHVMLQYGRYDLPGKLMAYIGLSQPSRELLATIKRIYLGLLASRKYTTSLAHRHVHDLEFEFMRELHATLQHENFDEATILASVHQFLIDDLIDNLQLHIPKGANLCFTGGCALNIKWNSALRDSGHFAHIWVPPFPNDCGSAIGTAACEMITQEGRWHLDWDVYSGPVLSDSDGDGTWDVAVCTAGELGTMLHEFESDAFIVLYGAAELGPRALGHRSIVCAATRAENKVMLNTMKGREDFRPVAPICLERFAKSAFSPGTPDPYMLFEHRVNADWRGKIPAVVHVDGSARLQTINKGQCPMLYDLLASYYRASGVPVICNTSANFHGKGFFPDVRSAMTWGKNHGVRFIWANGKLFTRVLPQEEVAEPQPNGADILDDMAATYRERNKLYGNNYKDFGKILAVMFPNGVTLNVPGDYNRFSLLSMVVAKMTRYALNFDRGGHLDSAHDAGVYAAMLEEVTRLEKGKI